MMSNTSMPIDYYVNISLSDDKLIAYLQFTNVDDNFSCTIGQLEDIMKTFLIHHGVQYDILAKITQDPKPFFFQKVVIAVGDSPVDGENGYIHYLYDLNNEDKKPTEMEDGKVDYKETSSLANVRKGQLIAQRFPAKEGIPGKAVTGESIFSKKGKEARFKIGKNVVADAEQNALYAAIDGMVVKTDRDKMNVFPVYEVNGDVDYKTGNIDFVGNVVIRGNVLTGFKVKAQGDIRVIGGVEGAELESGGSIEITAGILGHNKGFIRAGKNVKSSFIQDANVEASEDVLVSQSIMHSQIRAGRDVICKGSKGLIVGGTIQAGEKVVARTIGNTMSTPTAIEVGVLPELRNELLQLRNQMKIQLDNLDKTDKALTLLDQLAAAGQLSPDKLAMRIKLQHTKKQGVEELNAMKERTLEIEKSLENTDLAKVEVHTTIYGGSKIVIGRYTRFIKDATSRVYFKYLEGDVAMISLS